MEVVEDAAPYELAGMGQEGDRIEILWGLDYGGRYNFLVFKGSRFQRSFVPLPKAEEVELRMIDKRNELALFDPEEGLR